MSHLDMVGLVGFGLRGVIMVSVSEVKKRLEAYLAGAESLEDFAYWLSREASSIPYNADAQLFDLVAAILNVVQVNFDGHIDNVLLKDELSRLREHGEVREVEIRFDFDDAPIHSLKPNLVLRPAANSQVAFEAVSG